LKLVKFISWFFVGHKWNRIKTISPALAGEKKFRAGAGIFSGGGRRSRGEGRPRRPPRREREVTDSLAPSQMNFYYV